jgi:hypothetical protein
MLKQPRRQARFFAVSDNARLDTAPMQHRGKRSADLRIGTNRRFPANLAESEFGAPGFAWQHNPVDFYNLSFAKRELDSCHQNRRLC